MLEIPESQTVADQLNHVIQGKVVELVAANQSPHRYAFYFGDPERYNDRLRGKTVGISRALGGLVEIEMENMRILLGDGAIVRYYGAGE